MDIKLFLRKLTEKFTMLVSPRLEYSREQDAVVLKLAVDHTWYLIVLDDCDFQRDVDELVNLVAARMFTPNKNA